MIRSRVWTWTLALLLSTLCAQGALARGDGDDGDDASWHEMPEWVSHLGITGRYVGTVDGSSGKYLEDHNIQSGPILTLGIEEAVADEGILFVEGMVEPLQDQGYLLFELDVPERFSIHSDIQAWREFYNSRTGESDQTVFGGLLDSGGIFPNTNNSNYFYGGGKPKVDWLRTRSGVAVELPGFFNDFSADILYRRVRGEASLLKGGTVFDPAAPLVIGSGPGSVLFDVSGRKQVDYESIGGEGQLRLRPLGLNVQFDWRGMHHELKSTVSEANFTTSAATSEMEGFGRDTTIDMANYDVVVSHNLSHNTFVFGSQSFSWERSEPSPSQVVQTGLLGAASTRVLTRNTASSEITRLTGALSGGVVFMPTPKIKIRGNASLRAIWQEADLTEDRNEIGFPGIGDIGSIINESKRDMYSMRLRLKGDWHAMKRLKVSGIAQFDYRYDDVSSRRDLNFVVVEAPEIEDYTNERTQFKLGASARYRFRKGRILEGGYEFNYVGFTNDINSLSNQFVVADYERLRHRIHVKAAGRFTRKLRGELRVQYVFETRTLDAPNVDPADFVAGSEGEIEIWNLTVSPVLTYQYNTRLSGVLSGSIGRQQYTLVDDGPSPLGFSSRFAGFQYKALTGSMTMAVNWAPSEKIRYVASYTLYGNAESVENTGHDASIRSSYSLDENWDVNGSLRYLGFVPDDNTLDEYHTVILSLGLTGRF